MRIEDMSIDQLLELNEIICRRIDELRARKDFDVLRQLRIGQQVHFNSQEGRIFGTVIKINRKTVVVLTEDRRQWKLPAGMVTVVRDVD